MPLSEHEQRLLEQIERALVDDDPKFASSVRTGDRRLKSRRRLQIGAALVVVGFAGFFTGFGRDPCLKRYRATRGEAEFRAAIRSACRSRRLTLSCSARRFCRCHCSMTCGGGTSTVHSPRVIAASQCCMMMLVTGKWSSAVSEMVQ